MNGTQKKFESLKYAKIIVSIALILMLVGTYGFRIRYSLWYDEAAVVENARNLSLVDLNKGLNWLQTIPLGYFLLAKALLQFSFGVELLRILSMASFLTGCWMSLRFLMPAHTTYVHRTVFVFALLFNPISVLYATMVKPYALEFLFSIISLCLFQLRKTKALVAVGFLAPLFANSSILILIAIVLVLLLKDRKIRQPITLFLVIGFSTFISLFFTAPGTRDLMRLVWFGEIEVIGLQSFKSAIGNLGWLSVSGLGILPENGSSTLYLTISLLTLLFLLTLSLMSLNELSGVLATAVVLAIVAQSLILMPAAGRLLLGISGLIWILTISSVSRLGKKASNAICLALVLAITTSSLVTQTWLNKKGYSHVKETLASIKEEEIKSDVYFSLWAGPSTMYYLGEDKDRINPNTIWVDSDSKLHACRPTTLKPLDLILFDNVPNPTLRQVGAKNLLKEISIVEMSGLFEVMTSIPVGGIENPNKNLSCMYHWTNPQFPAKEPINAK